MNKRVLLILALVVVVIAAVALLVASQRLAATSPASSRLTVAATIFPLADMVKEIGGSDVEVILIIPPGVTEHSNELRPQQVQRLQKARAVFQIGHGLDDRLTQRIVRTLPTISLITVDRGIELKEFNKDMEETDKQSNEEESDHHDTGIDPHYWLTVPNAMIIAATINKTLQDLDPAHAGSFEQRFVAYQHQLGQLEAELQHAARATPRKEFIAMHNAWSYFSAHYGMRLVATYEPTEGQQPSIADLKRLKDTIQQYRLTTFYVEPQKASTAVTNFLQHEFGLTVKVLDPVGGRPETPTYSDLMRFNMAALKI